MTEADLDREAVKLFQQLGLKVGAESLEFFRAESLYIKDWKNSFKPRSKGSIMSTSRTVANPHQRKIKPLVINPGTSDIGSEGSPNASPGTSNESTDREDEGELDEYFGPCAMCDLPVIGEETGCLALEQIFHNRCFKCNKCFKVLSGNSFFIRGGLILCEKDYYLTLDKCYTCQQVITEKVIRALGHTYHPVCFRCNVCGLCLDGVPFAADFTNKAYCEKDFHKMFAPRCAVCQDPIIPSPGNKKSTRLIAMNSSFHIDCYRCSECDVLLVTDKESGPLCYPIAEHPLCLGCNKVWASRGQTSLSRTGITS